MDLDVLILRDPRESTKKCSLTPLRGRSGIRFVSYDRDRRLSTGRRILLDPDGEEFRAEDRGLPLLLIDCAWRRVPDLRATIDGELLPRRLPPLVTAYPRKSKMFADPARGLASIEALYAALALLGDARPELLAHYRWAEEFLSLNAELPASPIPLPGADSRSM
jgi:pre-rRNA-processing protein TSR3